MRALARVTGVLALALLGALAVGCKGCAGHALAELIDAKGKVERDMAASVGAWLAAEQGARFEVGDGLRTASDATATLRVGRKGRVHVEGDTTIRFSRNKGQAQDAPPALEVEQGQARVEAGEEALTLRTELGQAVLGAGASISVSRADGGTRYRVLVGSATFDGSDGKAKPLAAGESIMIGLGTAVFEAMPPKTAARAAAEATSAAAVPAPVDGGPNEAAPSAELQVTATIQGIVRRRGADDEAWSPLAQGTSALGADDELDVGASARASLQRGGERALLSQGRYRVGAVDAPLVRALDGSVQVEAGEGQSVRIAVPGGTITALAVAGGTQASIAVRGEDGRTDIRVERGKVDAAGGDKKLSLGQGERGELAARAASAEPARALEQAELTVTAGELFRVYDPKPPTIVGFKVGKACGEGLAEVRIDGEAEGRGRGQVNVAIGPGMHDYAVHCVEGEVALAKAALRTKARIVRNDGARKLPTTPPKNEVAVDGRRYTLMYQNLKPVLTVRWRDAPKAASYVLYVTPPRGATVSLRSNQPQHVIPANIVKDGTHRVQFETSGKTKVSSKETLIDVTFDNAAPTASLELPPASGFTPGGKVDVAGVAIDGSRVSVDGKDLPLDAQQRFRSQIARGEQERAIAVRVQHPRDGVRYYLRRATGP